MKVGFISQFFPPEPVLVPDWIARALRERGAEVQVLTGVPNFPTGRVHSSYSAWKFGRDPLDSRVIRTPLYPNHDQRVIRRIANYVSWAVSASAGVMIFLRDRDVNLVYSSPATTALPALVAKLFFQTPYVLLIQDVWPDSIISTGLIRSRRLLRITESAVSVLVNFCYRHAHAIAVTSPSMESLLIERGVPPEKVSFVANWADETLFTPAQANSTLRYDLGISRLSNLVIYAGNLGAAQDLAAFIRAVAETNPNLHLIVAGDGVEKDDLENLSQELAPERIHFLGRVPANRMPELIAATDTALISLRADPLFSITLPSKVQTLLASGASVLCRADGDAANIVRSAGGVSVKPSDHEGLVAALDLLATLTPEERSRRRAASRAYYREHLSEEKNANKLFRMLNESRERRR